MFTMHPFTKLVNTVGLFYNFLVPELKQLLLSEQTINRFEIESCFFCLFRQCFYKYSNQVLAYNQECCQLFINFLTIYENRQLGVLIQKYNFHPPLSYDRHEQNLSSAPELLDEGNPTDWSSSHLLNHWRPSQRSRFL